MLIKIIFVFSIHGLLAQGDATHSKPIAEDEFLQKMTQELDSSSSTKTTQENAQPSNKKIKKLVRKRTKPLEQPKLSVKQESVGPSVESAPGYIPDQHEPSYPKYNKEPSSFFDFDSRYGRYRFSLGVAKAEFSDKQFKDIYDAIYDDASYYPKISVDWLPIDWFVGLGLRFSVGYYSDSGKAPTQSSTVDNITKSSTDIRIKMYPLQLGIGIAATPFKNIRWLSLQGWTGVERVYYSESFPDSESDGKTFLAKDSDDFMFYGGAVNIGLNFLDEQSINSMRSTMGIGYFYLSASYEISDRLSDDKKKLPLDRTTLGLSFSFESAI